jgi:hypothetical protein
MQSAARTLKALRSGHRAADARKDAPCRLVAAAYLALQGACADACLLARHEPDRHEPLPELEVGPYVLIDLDHDGRRMSVEEAVANLTPFAG